MISRLGKTPQGEILEKIQKSPNYINGAFRNREKPTPDLKMKNPSKIIYEYFTTKKDVLPHQIVPAEYTPLDAVDTDVPSFLWLGHSSYFIFWKNFKVLVDPVFSTNASPVYGTNVAFPGTTIYSVEDVPHIDILILTHDHFDHLDFFSIKNIHTRVNKVFCALGMESHLIYWGVPAEKIHSLDWDESAAVNEEIQITALTTRHNSGRTLVRNQTLWNAYSLQLGKYKLFICGDGGYGNHFLLNGEKYGPFDFGTIENGQYNTAWPKNHMFPEQSVKASIELGIQTVVPIHWGRFALSLHKWNESILRFTHTAEEMKVNFCVPKIGQLYTIDQPALKDTWWDFS